MRSHITRFHLTEESGRRQAVVAAATSGATDQRTIEEAIRKLPPSSEKAKRITKAIAAFIAKDLCPYSVVENQGYRALLHTLEPRYTIPSRRYFTDTLQPNQNGSHGLTVEGRQLDSKTLTKRWRRQTLHLGQVEVTLSLKYCPHPLEPPSSTPQQQQPVFCVPIQTVAQQEGVLVPHVVRCCVEEVERRGMDEVGIYRVSGTASDINALKTAFNSNLREAVTRLRSAEVNAVSGVLKLYLRELPESLMPTELFQGLARTLDIQDINSRLVSMLSLLHSCPEPNRHTFLFLLHHLQRVSEKQDVNRMTLMNLATVFGPSLIRPPVVGLGHDGPTMDISQEVVVQVQVLFCYLQCNNLPEAQTSLPYDTDSEDETTHM